MRSHDTIQPPSVDRPTAGRQSRRDLLAKALVAAGGAAALWRGRAGRAAEIRRDETAHTLDQPEVFAEGNKLERMRADLKRTLNKPVEQHKWVMVIDLHKCIGCGACTASCISENNLPPGVVYRPVTKVEVGLYPDVRKKFLPRPCMHCENPPCVPPCPVGATYKRPDGIVAIDYDQCIGCRYCVTACPYGARYFDFGDYYEDDTPEIMDYETRPSPEYAQNRSRHPEETMKSPIGNARKCHYCIHRFQNGMLPACVTTCLGGATFFGDYNDDKSLIHNLIGSRRVMRLLEDMGTEPKTYYLV